MADDRNMVIKGAGRGSSVVVWDRIGYEKGSEKQLSDENVYKKVEFKEKILTNLVETSTYLFKNLKTKGCISDKNLKLRFYL